MTYDQMVVAMLLMGFVIGVLCLACIALNAKYSKEQDYAKRTSDSYTSLMEEFNKTNDKLRMAANKINYYQAECSSLKETLDDMFKPRVIYDEKAKVIPIDAVKPSSYL